MAFQWSWLVVGGFRSAQVGFRSLWAGVGPLVLVGGRGFARHGPPQVLDLFCFHYLVFFFFFGGDLWLLWLVVWVIVVVILVVGGGFSLWVWIFCAEIDFEWVS